MKAQKLNRRQARWALYLSRFSFMLKYVPESKMEKADSLSRIPDWKIGVNKDNKNKTLVKPKWLIVKRTEKIDHYERSQSTRESEMVKGKRQ